MEINDFAATHPFSTYKRTIVRSSARSTLGRWVGRAMSGPGGSDAGSTGLGGGTCSELPRPLAPVPIFLLS